MYIFATFHNRTQALQFASSLKAMGVNNKIINTPREISTSCGLTIIFDYKQLNRARALINSQKYMSFRGFYIKKEYGRHYSYEKIN